MTKCFQMNSLSSTLSHITDGCIDSSPLRIGVDASMFSSRSPARTLTLFLRREECELSIKQPALCPILPGVREKREHSFMRDTDINALCCPVVAVQNIFTSLPGPASVAAGMLFTKERLSPDLHLQHAGSDTCNASCAPAKGWPACQWSSPCCPHPSLPPQPSLQTQ